MSSNLPFFLNKIYCINLDRRKDRWINAQKEFKRLWIQGFIKRISGIEKKPWNLGCLLSHLKIHKISNKKNEDYILVLEDDAIFHVDFDYIIRLIEEVMVFNPDLVYLGGSFWPTTQLESISENWYRATGIWKMHAYIISNKWKNMLRKDIDSMWWPEKFIQKYKNFDTWIALNLSERITCYFPKKNLCNQNSGISDTSWNIKDIQWKELVFTYFIKLIHTRVWTSIKINIFSKYILKKYLKYVKGY